MKHKDFRELLARAEAGEAQTQYDLGLLCRSAETEVPDYAGAVSWFRLAALQGHALAQYDLGRLYEAGAGVGRDLGKALRWYRRAADQGLPEARVRLLEFFAALGEAAYDRMYEVDAAAAKAANAWRTSRRCFATSSPRIPRGARRASR